jgi:hypothetical protein
MFFVNVFSHVARLGIRGVWTAGTGWPCTRDIPHVAFCVHGLTGLGNVSNVYSPRSFVIITHTVAYAIGPELRSVTRGRNVAGELPLSQNGLDDST